MKIGICNEIFEGWDTKEVIYFIKELGPGFGNVDYKPIIETLKEIGYSGFISVEVFDFSPGSEIIARKSIEYLKKFLS